MRFLFFIALFFVAFACSKGEPKLEIERYDEALMSVKSKEELVAFLKKNESAMSLIFQTDVNQAGFAENLFEMINHPEAKALFLESKQTFGDLTSLNKDFTEAFTNIKKLYPEFKAPKVGVAFTGLQNDMVVTDSLVVISLEAFIGPQAKFRPDQPTYILHRYAPNYIVPSVIRYISNQFNKVNFEPETFTAEMVFYGKQLEFVRQVMPSTPDSLIIAFTNRELQNSYENQDYIWEHVIDRELLNNTDPARIGKYFAERPFVGEISPDCPGRIGQWLGLRVIELYREANPKVSFQELMKNENAEDILRGSKYRGQKSDK